MRPRFASASPFRLRVPVSPPSSPFRLRFASVSPPVPVSPPLQENEMRPRFAPRPSSPFRPFRLSGVGSIRLSSPEYRYVE